MDERQPPGRVEDFTDAFLVSFGVVVFIGFFAIMAVLGWLWVGVVALGADRLIQGFGRRA